VGAARAGVGANGSGPAAARAVGANPALGGEDDDGLSAEGFTRELCAILEEGRVSEGGARQASAEQMRLQTPVGGPVVGGPVVGGPAVGGPVVGGPAVGWPRAELVADGAEREAVVLDQVRT